MSQFHEYSEWLGVPRERLGPEGRPRNHYDLLGLTPETATVERVHAAVQELFTRIRTYETSKKPGVQERVTQLRAEIAAADLCLASPKRKREYDQSQFGRAFDLLQEAPAETEAKAVQSAVIDDAATTVADATLPDSTVAIVKQTENKGAEGAAAVQPVPEKAPADSPGRRDTEVIEAEVVPEKEPRGRSVLAGAFGVSVWLLLLPFRLVDRLLGLIVGQENDILRWFLRIMVGAAASGAIAYYGVLPLLRPSRPAGNSAALAHAEAGGRGSEEGRELSDDEEMTEAELEFRETLTAMDEDAGANSREDGAATQGASKRSWVRKILPNWLVPKSPSAAASDATPAAIPTSPEATKPDWIPGQGPPPLAIAPFDAKQAQEHQRRWADYLKVPVSFKNSIGMEFVLIPPGEFLMGASDAVPDPLPDERPQHLVRITKPFYLGKCEVTWGQYEILMRRFSARIKPGTKKALAKLNDDDPFGDTPSRPFPDMPNRDAPVESEHWGNASRFCRELSARPDTVPRRYRLPTEAEWEYACRAGTTADSLPDNLADYAWSAGSTRSAGRARMAFDDADPFGESPRDPAVRASVRDSGAKTHAVGQKLPNAFGLHDMFGNVWEMCEDSYASDYYQRSPIEDPRCLDTGTHKVLRGGAWNSDPANTSPRNGLQPFHRGGIPPRGSTDFIGFRVACDVPDGTASQPSPQPPPSEDADPFK